MIQREAYKGSEFTIEWYFDEEDTSQPLEYFLALAPDRKRKVLRLFRLMAELGILRDQTKFRFEGESVYAFKPQPDRFLCFFFKGKKIIVTNAFAKKQDKLPINEKERALRHKTDYEHRVKMRSYYV